jgi:VanZ family protein
VEAYVKPPSARNSGKIAAALLLWLLAMAVVITGELLPGSSPVMRWIGSNHINDKLLHFVAYTGLAVIPVFGFRVRAGLAAAASMILLGVALEFLQRLVPGRSFEVADMVANALGVLTGVTLGVIGRQLLRLPGGPDMEGGL